jgi:hypothetical protein
VAAPSTPPATPPTLATGTPTANYAVLRWDNNVVTVPFVGDEARARALAARMTSETHKHHVFVRRSQSSTLPPGSYARLSLCCGCQPHSAFALHAPSALACVRNYVRTHMMRADHACCLLMCAAAPSTLVLCVCCLFPVDDHGSASALAVCRCAPLARAVTSLRVCSVCAGRACKLPLILAPTMMCTDRIGCILMCSVRAYARPRWALFRTRTAGALRK